MSREIPEVVRAAAGLAATVLDEARKLPETLPSLPVRLIGLAMQQAMKVQQHYAGLVARGDELFTGIRGENEPGLATFDDDELAAPAPSNGFRDSAFDRAGDRLAAADDDTLTEFETEALPADALVDDLAEQIEAAGLSIEELAADAPGTDEILDEIAIDELIDQAPTLEETAPGASVDDAPVTEDAVVLELALLESDSPAATDQATTGTTSRKAAKKAAKKSAPAKRPAKKAAAKADTADTAVTDTAAADTAASDTQATDTKATDTAATDTAASDTKATDTQAADTAAADTAESDTKATDTQATDAQAADTAADTAASDTKATDTAVSDTQATDAQAADTAATDTTATDTTATDAQAADTGATDTNAGPATATDESGSDVATATATGIRTDVGPTDTAEEDAAIERGAAVDVVAEASTAPTDEPQGGSEPSGSQAVGAAPVDGYDSFTIAQLRGRLRGYALSTVQDLVAYEEATRARPEYLRMLRNRLEKLEEQAVESSPFAPRGA